MKTLRNRILITALAAVALLPTTNAAEQPAFPKVGVEYVFSVAGGKFGDLAPAGQILIEKWIAGDWYQVAVSDAAGVWRTNLNISQILALREASNPRVSKAIARDAEKEKPAKK